MKKYQAIRELIRAVMEDGKVHTAEELQKICESRGIEINRNRSEIYNTVHQLKKKGIIISDGENGYLLVEMEKSATLAMKKGAQERLGLNCEKIIGTLDLSEFEIVKPAIRKDAKQVISIFDNGDLALNSVLSRRLKTNKIEIRIKKDCSQILLVPEGEVLLDITKNNRIKNYQIYEKLRGKKVKFPVYYIGDWDEENGIWIGELVMTNPNKTKGKVEK